VTFWFCNLKKISFNGFLWLAATETKDQTPKPQEGEKISIQKQIVFYFKLISF